VAKLALVVGNGMVGHRFCRKMVEYDRCRQYRIRVLGEERHAAYDRVQLTSYFANRSVDSLLLEAPGWYEEHGIDLRLTTKATDLDTQARRVRTQSGDSFEYDVLVLATGAVPAIPPIPGVRKRGVFAYRTLDDVEHIATGARGARRGVVIGGGLLGLEAARALLDAGLHTHVVEVAPRLMPAQLDPTGSWFLEQELLGLGIEVHLENRVQCILGEDDVTGVELSDGRLIDADIVVVCTGIRPRDELARTAGLALGSAGGVVVDNHLRTTDENVYAIGEVALHHGVIYGLVAPGYEMAATLARNLCEGVSGSFEGSDMSARLKLCGADVATFGDPFQPADETRVLAFEDQMRGVYKRLVVHKDSRQLLGGILVGDTSSYGALLGLTRSKTSLSEGLEELGLSGRPAAGPPVGGNERVCSCNDVTADTIRLRIRGDGLNTVSQIKACTRAGAGCGGCLPQVTDILAAELAAMGKAVKPRLCEHFAFTRQELFQIVAARGIRTFGQLLADHGSGSGCEVCKPTVASILASVHNEPVLDPRHRTLQDTNDRFLANIQKDGTYSVVPRVPGGEITADQLITLGIVAKKFKLYSKITGGQRVDLFGAQLEQLPEIWEELIAAGFESGHAYGKALRTVKSCVGSTWCRYGVQDSTGFAIRLENRYKGIRGPHKMKSAVSGCIRECAEAQGKDFGVIATEKGWDVYVGGNGGASPRHAELLASGLADETAIRMIDRFLMFYIRTADRLTRTSVWLDKMEGGIEHLRRVVVEDSLGIAADLERDMAKLVEGYFCEWKDAVNDPVKRASFRRLSAEVPANVAAPAGPAALQPAPSAESSAPAHAGSVRRLKVLHRQWVRLAAVNDVPRDGGIAVQYGPAQIALFWFASRGEWYATQNACPHTNADVLARGILGDHGGTPKVACPMHKKTFDLRTGDCLSGESFGLQTFPVRVEGDHLWAELPPAAEFSGGCETGCEDEDQDRDAMVG
jgi:nitrite reductase (NADH) large subunit